MLKVIDVCVESDLYIAGHTSDGEEYTAEVYFVCVEFEGGEMYAHRACFPGCKMETDDEGYSHFEDVRAEANGQAEKLCARVMAAVKAGRELNMAHWHFRRTRYGSQAYLDEVAEMTPQQRAGEPD